MNVCICHPNADAYSETFIKAHIERLPMTVIEVCGHYPGESDGKPIAAAWRRLLHRYNNRLPSAFGATGLFDRAFEQFLRKNSIDVTLAEYGPTGVLTALACRRANVPLVVHFHGYDAFEQKVLAAFNSYRTVFAMAGAIVSVSKHMELQLRKLGCPEEKLFCNPYGVDVGVFEGRCSGSAPPVFLAVGRFVDKKAPDLTILAFERVAQRIPEARLIMAGDGPLLECCQRLVHTLGIADRVEFPGALRHDEVAQTMRRVRAFVQHSVQTNTGNCEGTPVAILEAGASGLPVISTRHAGIPDVVLHGETGFLVEERDVLGMSEWMELVAVDTNLATRVGHAARDRIKAHFSSQQSIANLASILSRAAASG